VIVSFPIAQKISRTPKKAPELVRAFVKISFHGVGLINFYSLKNCFRPLTQKRKGRGEEVWGKIFALPVVSLCDMVY